MFQLENKIWTFRNGTIERKFDKNPIFRTYINPAAGTVSQPLNRKLLDSNQGLQNDSINNTLLASHFSSENPAMSPHPHSVLVNFSLPAELLALLSTACLSTLGALSGMSRTRALSCMSTTQHCQQSLTEVASKNIKEKLKEKQQVVIIVSQQMSRDGRFTKNFR